MSARDSIAGFRRGAVCAIAAVMALPGLWAIAVESGAQALELEEILVTAQRRDEDRQDVIASLTALEGQALVDSAIQDVTDLPLYVPGLIISQIAASQISLRGISTQAQSVGGDPGVATYKDDIYLSRPGMAYVSFFDTERVEVLRGPQGTLYGRNTTGGVLHIISRKPEEEAGGYLIGQYGRFDKRRFEGAVNIPMSDEFAIRAAGLYHKRNGYLTNLHDGKKVMDADEYAIRLTGQWTGESATAVLQYEHTQTDSVIDPFKALTPGLANFAFGGYSPIDEWDEVNQNYPLVDDKTLHTLTLRIDWDLSEQVTLTSITGWRDFDVFELNDLDDTQVELASYYGDMYAKTVQQEFQLNFTNDRLTLISGAFFWWEEAEQQLDFPFFPPGVLHSQPYVDTFSWAVFGQGTYSLTDQWRLTVGLRYTDDKKDFTNEHGYIPFFPLAYQDVTGNYDAVTGRVALEYDLSDDVLVWASVSRGYKGGGFNGAGIAPPFDSEYLMAYEAGINATFADNRVEMNLTGFYSDYTDMQVQRIVSIGSVIDNAGEASGGGAELELRALLTDTVSLNLGISVADMKFDSFLSADPVEPAAGIKQLGGNDLPRVAPFTGSGSLNLAQPLANGGALNASFEVQHQGRIYFDQFNREINSQKAFTVINARFGYDSPEDVWYVAAYGKNLTDKKYTESRFEIAELGGTVFGVIGPPVEYGVEVGYNF